MAHNVKKLGSVGGAGSSATPGGYNQGNSIAAKGNYSGAVDGIQQMDLRKGNAAGFGPSPAPAGTGYKQGDMFAAQKGRSSVDGQPTVSTGDLRGGSAKTGTYNQGNQFGASKK